jgi:putative transposase
MARPEAIGIVKHISLEELNNIRPKTGKDAAVAARVQQRLTFIRMRYLGYSVPEASEAAGMTFQTGYNIQKDWNEGGPAALCPKFGGGRPSKMTDEQKAELSDLLLINPMDSKDVRAFIEDEYGISYSMKQTYVILSGMRLHHAKPYPEDHRRPDDAEDILKKDSRRA